MGRLHLMELEDQPWFPAVIRDAGTAYLRKATEIAGQPKYMAPKLAELLRASGVSRIVDLCSGGAGPIPAVLAELRADGVDATATLTDLYPNLSSMQFAAAEAEGQIEIRREPVDATAVPDSLPGCRTLFNAFHHFRPEDARRVLQSAVDSKQPIAVFEAVERSAPFLIGILFSPIMVLALVPFLRPFDWRWLVFTYLIPLIPFFVLFDGFVSGLRVYSVSELDDLVADLNAPGYTWESGRVKVGSQPAHVTYLIGRPATA